MDDCGVCVAYVCRCRAGVVAGGVTGDSLAPATEVGATLESVHPELRERGILGPHECERRCTRCLFSSLESARKAFGSLQVVLLHLCLLLCLASVHDQEGRKCHCAEDGQSSQGDTCNCSR